MSKETDISRRKLLGGLGVIGGAGALGGSGTVALLWDEEVFGNADTPNVLQAGQLDLKVDWEEHYVDWIGAETEYDVVMVENGEVPAGYVGLPTPTNPLIAVHQDDIGAFMDATVTETSDEFDGPDDINASEEDAPHDLVDQPDPVVTIQDVKPGDFGEVTFSYHLFGNPGFVTACADVIADEDNGIVEPEDKVNGHDPDGSDGTEGGDLGDHARAELWYDPNCNNRFDGGEVEVMMVTDVSESMNTVKLPGAPNVDGNADDENADGDDTALEAVKAGVGDSVGNGFITQLQNSCADSVELGVVSAGTNLNHLDNLSDGDDAGAGFDGDDLDAHLDHGLHGVDEQVVEDEHKKLFAGGTDFSPDFVTEDPETSDDYEAERPYVEDGGSKVPQGVNKAHKALIPSGDSTSIPGEVGIDPHGAAGEPGTVRKIMVVMTDGAFSESQNDPVQFAQDVSNRAEDDEIDVFPIITNPDPTPQDVDFALELACPGCDPYFATHYGPADSPGSCPGAISAEPDAECTSLVEAFEDLRKEICASAGSDAVIASGTLNEVMADLGGFDEGCNTLLDPMASGSGVASEFEGTDCHEPSTTGCLALAWWVPRDIPGVNDNIIDTDRYEFTLSFNAVQCRHNVTENGEPISISPSEADAQAGD